MDWSTCTIEPSLRSVSEKKRKIITSSSCLPLIPCLLAADETAPQCSQRLPKTALKPKGFLYSKRQHCLTSTGPKQERTLAVFTPPYSSPTRISPREVSNKRDSRAIDRSDSEGSKRKRNCDKTEYLDVGKDTASCPYLPIDHLSDETLNRTFKLRPRKTQDTRISSLFSC